MMNVGTVTPNACLALQTFSPYYFYSSRLVYAVPDIYHTGTLGQRAEAKIGNNQKGQSCLSLTFKEKFRFQPTCPCEMSVPMRHKGI